MADFAHKQALPPDFRLGNYRVVRVLGVGGFGVTYLGKHARLGHQAALKEYLPNEFAVREGAAVHPKSPSDRDAFEWGLARFVDEARTLTRFRHPNLVRVSDYFEANNTAYIVMDYEDGEPLDVLLERHGTLTEAQLRRVVLPVADGLRQVHAAGFLHRDIKPSNIFVRRADESPVLLDFGAARQALSGRSKSMTTIASAGYSPPEQYESDGEHGPWTDIYALSALCRRAITGKTPLESTTRLNRILRTKSDPLTDLVGAGAPGYSRHFLAAVDKGLRLIEQERPQHIDDWISLAKGRLNEKNEKVTKDAPAARPTPDNPPLSRNGFFWKLARGEFGLAKTYWLYDTAVFVVAACAWVWLGFVFGQNAAQDQEHVRNWGLAYLLVKILASAFVIAHLPYRIISMVGVWRSAGAYAGRKLWSVLARVHLVIQVACVPLGWTDKWVAWTFGNAIGAGMFLLVPAAFIWGARKLWLRRKPKSSASESSPASRDIPTTDSERKSRRTVWRVTYYNIALVALIVIGGIAILSQDEQREDEEAHRPNVATTKISAPKHKRQDTQARGAEPLETSSSYDQVTLPNAGVEFVDVHPPPMQRGTSLQARAESGDAEAQFKLGGMHLLGNGVPKNEAVGAHWTRKAAEQGHVQATFALGMMYVTGKGVSKDLAEAANWLRAAAEWGHAEAQHRLGLLYELGEGVAKDDIQAVRWYRKAAEQGYADAQHDLGFMYAVGEGVEQNDRQAWLWIHKAAKQGLSKSQFEVGAMLYGGIGAQKDVASAVLWYRKAAQQGHAQAQNNLGFMYANGDGVPVDDAKAAIWYRKAAEQGEPVAQASLGNAYLAGLGVPQDFGEALRWNRKAAEQGDASGQHNLGAMCFAGNGVPKSYECAASWFRKAAEQGLAASQNNLGIMHFNGYGVQQDFEQAEYWFRKAAEQGLAQAQFYLAGLYESGDGVPQDNVYAYAWASLAEKQGTSWIPAGAHSDVESALRNLRRKLSNEQIRSAQRLAASLVN